MEQGIEHAAHAPRLSLLTDADIDHAPDTCAAGGAGRERQPVLISLMAKLRCESFAERAADPRLRLLLPDAVPVRLGERAAPEDRRGAGGCMLVRRDALERAGGIDAIRTALIDDCALGALMKRQGPIWLGLTERVAQHPALSGIARHRARMVSRSAYAQLRYSPLLLAGTVAGMASSISRRRFWRSSATASARGSASLPGRDDALLPADAALLPPLAALGCGSAGDRRLSTRLFTLQSAFQHLRGRGGMWKGAASGRARDALMS